MTLIDFTANDPLLHLERESDKHWVVTNLNGDPDLVVFRALSRKQAVGLARTFVMLTGGARLDDSFESSGGDPQVVEPAQVPVSLAATAATVEPASSLDTYSVRVPSNVIPIDRKVPA